MAKGISTRGKYLGGIMNRQGFGELVISKNGIDFKVPNDWLNKDGSIKKTALAKLQMIFNNTNEQHIA